MTVPRRGSEPGQSPQLLNTSRALRACEVDDSRFPRRFVRRIEQHRDALADLAEGRKIARDDRRSRAQRLDERQAIALGKAREEQGSRSGEMAGKLIVGTKVELEHMA